jgi:predicted amidohydrolase
MTKLRIASIVLFILGVPIAELCSQPEGTSAPAGWQARAPRDEIRPHFQYDPKGGQKANGSFAIIHDKRDGLDGWWQKTYPIAGGKFYQFHAARQTVDVETPRRSAIVRLVWQDDQGKLVYTDPPDDGVKGGVPRAEPEYPMDGDTIKGWTEVAGLYRAPSKATKAVVELHLRWSPGGRVDWSEVALTESAPPTPRPVRLATVHFMPKGGKTPMDNCRMYEPFIADAARQKADLVVLGETITVVGLGLKYVDVAEKIPGPSTEYFCALAKQHKIHIVVGLVERDGHLIYNVAVLIGPDGRIIGVYRKVCLPRSEVEGGLSPGRDYPVFNTKLGKIGMMVCYDGFFPEPARELTKRGAEVICWPVWGCNPMLASARACENHVFLVSSTYTDLSAKWTLSAVYDHAGQPLVKGEKWGTVVVADVDLSRRHFWRNNLGDFKSENFRSRPIAMPELK